MEASPLMLCTDCKDKKFCSTPCKALTTYLKKNGIYSADYIRPMVSHLKRKDGFGKYREIPFSAMGNKIKRQIGEEMPESDTND